MMMQFVEKTHLSATGLLRKTRDVFKKIQEPKLVNKGKKKEISIVDCCMSALAMFKLKFPSMLPIGITMT